MEVTMRAHQIMTRPVITVTLDSTIVEAAKIMLEHHISGLPVVDATGKLIGIVSEDDFIRRSEIGTQRTRANLLQAVASLARQVPDPTADEGVVKVHDHLRWMDPMSGVTLNSPKDGGSARAS
jgi:CBS domain-containing protein